MANWTEVASTEELPAGEKICTTAEGTPIVVCNVDGDLFAVQNICPHAGLPLGEGGIQGKVLVCPFHGYAYNVDSGKNVDFEDDVPLTRFPIRCENGKIEVDLEPMQ